MKAWPMSFHRLKSIISWLALVAIALGLPCLAYSTHGSWQDHYRDAAGISCCNPNDCQVTIGRLLAQEGDRTQVEVQGVPLWFPAKSVHASEDGAFWICRKRSQKENESLTSDQIRCVFLAVGG